jgi:hypothetical protein
MDVVLPMRAPAMATSRVFPRGPHHAPAHDVTAHLQAGPVLGGYGRSLGVDVTPQAGLVPGQQPCPAVDVDRLGLPVPDRAPNQHCQDHQYYPFADRPVPWPAPASGRSP